MSSYQVWLFCHKESDFSVYENNTHLILIIFFLSGETYEAQSEAQSDEEEELCAQDLINFAPVYRCLHIYTVLGAREQFETYYRQQRREQARLALQPPTNMVS